MERIVTTCLSLLCITNYVVLSQDKRLLLHSDQDLYQVITTLQTEMAALNSSLRGEVASLTSSLEAAATEMAFLKSSFQTERTRTSSLQTEVAALQSKITTLETAAGSVYVRWGRTSCPGNGTEMVYKGRMAGSHYSKTNGGANQLCLPDNPTWGKHVDGMTGWANIYGTEMGVPDNVANVLFGKPVQDQDVPCAVCRTTRPTNVMIGGQATCYPGWTLEYQGYIVSNGHSHSNNADYVCLDTGLEFAPHGAAGDDDHIINVVEVVCGQLGSIPCPPYVNGRELSCVVCSK